MSIHFAAARSPLAALINPARHGRIVGRAANDNGGPAVHLQLRAALRHFAEHGLGAATVARKKIVGCVTCQCVIALGTRKCGCQSRQR